MELFHWLLVLLQLLPQLLLRPRLLSLLPRERLSQPLRLMPKLTLRLAPGCCTADTTDTDMDIMLHSPTPMLPMSTPMPTPTMVSHMPTMVRDLLMLMPTMDTMDTDSDHTDTEPMDMDTHTDMDTMVRGMLMLSQRLMLRLMLMLTMDTTGTDSDHTDTMDTELDTMDIHTDTDTGERSNFYCQNALNQIQPCFQ